MIGEPVKTSARDADSSDDIDGTVRSDGVETGRAPRHPWTDGDRARLRALCGQNLPSADIAARLGRTQRAVDAMSLRLGILRHESLRPWTEDECRLILRLHGEGASWAAIAEAVAGRSAIAVFRKLRNLVGPAPFKSAGQPKPVSVAEASAPPASAPGPPAFGPPAFEPPASEPPAPGPPAPEPFAFGPLASGPPPVVRPAFRPLRPPPSVPLPPMAVPVGVDAMVRWLRSRDFMVLHLPTGWQVDHRVLVTDGALLEFVNIRRGWLRLPPFILVETAGEAVAEVSGTGRGAQRFGALSFR